MANNELPKKALVLDYPSNNPRTQNNTVERREVSAVAQGTKKKRPLSKRASDALLNEDGQTVKDYLIWDILVPAAKQTIADTVGGGIEMLLFGAPRRGRYQSSRNRGRTTVINYGSESLRARERSDLRDRDARNRARNDFDDIEFKLRSEAMDVLSQLVDLIEDYGSASVADFYALAGITANYTDQNWGWENLSKAYVDRTRTGYIIDLPRPILLK